MSNKDKALKLALEALRSLNAATTEERIRRNTAIDALREALAQPEQEPVGRFAKFTDDIWREVTDGSPGVQLYTTPPKREWVGLTDDEREEIENRPFSQNDWLWFYTQAIEAKLKEKNT